MNDLIRDMQDGIYDIEDQLQEDLDLSTEKVEELRETLVMRQAMLAAAKHRALVEQMKRNVR